MTSNEAGGSRRDELSQHPADQLIRELVRTGREAMPEEIEQVVERMATAPFDPRVRSVGQQHRGLVYQGYALGEREPSLFYHLVKRVSVEAQWAAETTADEYLADLRRAIRATLASLVLYSHRGGAIAATLVPTAASVPLHRQGFRALPNLVVIYSADRGIIVTGYQYSALDRLRIPEGAQWLK